MTSGAGESGLLHQQEGDSHHRGPGEASKQAVCGKQMPGGLKQIKPRSSHEASRKHEGQHRVSLYAHGLGKCYTWVLGHEGSGERHRAQPAVHSSPPYPGKPCLQPGQRAAPALGCGPHLLLATQLACGGPSPRRPSWARSRGRSWERACVFESSRKDEGRGGLGHGQRPSPRERQGQACPCPGCKQSLPSVRALSFIWETRPLLGENHFNGLFFFPSSRNKDLRRNRKQWHGISQACAVGYSHLCEPVSFRKHAHFLKKNVSLFLKNGFLVHCPRNLLVLGRCVCALNLRPSGPGWGHPAGGCSTRKEDDPCGAGVQKWTAGVTAAGPSGKTTVPGEAGPGRRASGKGASEGGMSRC